MLTVRATQEANQNAITLQEDSADAVEEVLRKIYGCPLPAANARDWRFWFALITTADKYLEPGLSAKADQHFREVALTISEADVVFDVVQALKTDMSHVEPLLAFAEVLRKKNTKKLLKNERYRDLLVGDKDLMLAQLDELEVPPQQEGSKRQYTLCGTHLAQVFEPTDTAMSTCSVCIFGSRKFGQPQAAFRGIAYVLPPTLLK